MPTAFHLKHRTNPTVALPYSDGIQPSTFRIDGGATIDYMRMHTSRGSSIQTQVANSVAGPTSGVECGAQWITDPLTSDVTIAGTINVILWSLESNAAANAAINFYVDKIDGATGARTRIVTSARTTELGTVAASASFSATPGAPVDCKRGDRLLFGVFYDDAAAVTMAAGHTMTLRFNGPTAFADGDSTVRFAETFQVAVSNTMEQLDTLSLAGTGIGNIVGDAGISGERHAMPIIPWADGTLTEVKCILFKNGTPTGNLIIELQGDSAGVPNDVVVAAIASQSEAALTTTPTEMTYGGLSIPLTGGEKYWVVFRRDTADASNHPRIQTHDDFGQGLTRNSGTWSEMFSGDKVRFSITYDPTTTIYLTDDATDVATASVDREAWTDRGGGVASDVVNTAAGWTAPIQLTDSAGGTVVDWFTKPLAALTLGGVITANIRCASSSAAASIAARLEIAVVDLDGSNPVVWGVANMALITAGSVDRVMQTTETAQTIYVGGDDIDIDDGQRLRLRLYIDEAAPSGAMPASQTATFWYAGTSGGASGDSFITVNAELEEFVLGEPGYQRIVGPLQLPVAATTLWTVPDGFRAEVRSLDLNNPSGSLRKVTLSIGSDAAGTRVEELFDVPAGGSENKRRGFNHTLEAGEVLQGYADSAGVVVATINAYLEAL